MSNWQVKDFARDYCKFKKVYNGQDFGFNHANAILEIGWNEVDRELYIMRESYLFEKDTEDIIAINEGVFNKRIEMFCDSAEPDRIKMWRKAGYKAQGVVKERGASGKTSVAAQIDFLKSVRIIVHPSCPNTVKELEQWKWQKDKTTGLYVDTPVDAHDDLMAALRYSIEKIRKKKRSIYDSLF